VPVIRSAAAAVSKIGPGLGPLSQPTSEDTYTMKKLLSLMAMAACLSLGVAHAQDKAAPAAPAAPAMPATPAAPAAKAPTAQQSKMATCNKDAGAKKGDERKAFMKTCLSAKPVTQQDKMKSCNADPKAKALKGDERKAFMKECLSAKPAA